MFRRHVMLPALVLLGGVALLTARQAPPQPSSRAPRPPVATAPDRAQVLETMRRATIFMVEKVAAAGGFAWNYLFDTAGETSQREWYNTIGRNAWRLEEFQREWGNATFDDGGACAAPLLLRRPGGVGVRPRRRNCASGARRARRRQPGHGEPMARVHQSPLPGRWLEGSCAGRLLPHAGG